MHNMLNNKKAQFFILTTVIIVGVFYTMSKYINPYTFIDTSEPFYGTEILMFDNIANKAVKTIDISNTTNIADHMSLYKSFVENKTSDEGYILNFNYTIDGNQVNVTMFMVSETTKLKTSFTQTVS